MPKFLVRTVSTFYHTYVVECEEADHAADSVTCADADFLELHQEHVDESILEVTEITTQEQVDYFREKNDWGSSWSDEQVVVNTTNIVDYSWRDENDEPDSDHSDL